MPNDLQSDCKQGRVEGINLTLRLDATPRGQEGLEFNDWLHRSSSLSHFLNLVFFLNLNLNLNLNNFIASPSAIFSRLLLSMVLQAVPDRCSTLLSVIL